MSDFDNPLRQMVNAMSNLGSTHKILLWGDVGIESAKQEEVVQIAASARESLGWRQSANFCNFRCHIRARGGPMENFSFHHNRLADHCRGDCYLLWHIYTHGNTYLQNSNASDNNACPLLPQTQIYFIEPILPLSHMCGQGINWLGQICLFMW